MSDTGYIRLYRSLLGHPAFRNDGEAMVFAWMVLKASWRPSRVRYKGRPIALERGQLAVSVRDLAEHHDRPKGWIERLLKRLRDETMCETHSETGVLVITICNYNNYQAEIQASETVAETLTGQTQDSGRTQNKEGNKGIIDSPLPPEKPKSRNSSADQPSGVSDQVWIDFLKLRERQRAPVTGTVIRAYQREADKAGWSLETAIEESVLRGWRGFKAEWVANRHANAPPGQSGTTSFLDYKLRERQHQ